MTPTGKEEKAQSNFGLSRFFGVVTVNIDIVTTLLLLVCWGMLYLFGGVNYTVIFYIRFKSPSNWKINMYLKSLAGSRLIPLITQLLCPIMMIFMFKGNNHSCCSEKKEKEIKE